MSLIFLAGSNKIELNKQLIPPSEVNQNNTSTAMKVVNAISMPKLICNSNTNFVEMPIKDIVVEPKSRYKPIVPKQPLVNHSSNCNTSSLASNDDDKNTLKAKTKKHAVKLAGNKDVKLTNEQKSHEKAFERSHRQERTTIPVKILPKTEAITVSECQTSLNEQRRGQRSNSSHQISILDEAMEVSGILNENSKVESTKKFDDLKSDEGKS